MPRNVRNFWFSASVDGRESVLSAGPAAKDGGMDITLYLRRDGHVTEALSILCRARQDGTLTAEVVAADDNGRLDSKLLVKGRR